MKKFLSIIFFANLLLSGNAYAVISGNIKIKCITEDQSYILTAYIQYNGNDKPTAKLKSYNAKLISSPFTGGENYHLFAETITQLTEDTEIREFHKLEIDGDLLTGIYEMGFRKSILDKGEVKLKSNIICTMLENSVTSSNDGTNLSGSSGTAFFINKKGYLLTNNHVVDGCTLSKISYKNRDYDTKLIATDKTLDLALLKAELKPKTFINFSKDEAKKLVIIYVAGYPLGKGLSDDLKINPGAVSSLKGFEDNSNEIQIDAPINPGNSGGPIINENGDLVAIAVSGLAKDQTEGINFGIKSSAAERFLKSNNINVDKSLYSRFKNKEQLRNILEEGTVYTYCN